MSERAFSRLCLAVVLLGGLLAAVPTFAQGTRPTITTRGNFVREPHYETQGAALTFYVDPTGNDTNDCLSTGTGACLTIQGALFKAPKLLKDRVTINVAAGSYKGFYVSGFTMDPSVQQSNGGILIDGTIANSTTLATGTATGTATAGAVGALSVFGTLTDGTQTWTVNDLRGRFLSITGGTGAGQFAMIESNTATTITIEGTFTAIGAGSTYAIQDSTSVINTGIAAPPTAIAAGAANQGSIFVFGNTPGISIVVRGLSIQAATNGLQLLTPTAMQLLRTQFTTPVTTRISQKSGSLTVTTVSSLAASGGTGTHFQGVTTGDPTVTLISGYLATGGSNLTMLNAGVFQIFNASILDSNGSGGLAGVLWLRPITSTFSVAALLHITCHTTAFAAIQVGFGGVPTEQIIGAAGNGYQPLGFLSLNNVDVGTDSCGTAVYVPGGSVILSGNTTQLLGRTATLFYVTVGGRVTVGTVGSTFSATSTVTDISLDDGAATSTMAAVAAGSCFSTLGWGSAWCKF